MHQEVKNEKKRYDQPKLVAFGSVRNLTGGSGGRRGDGSLARTRF